MGKNNKRKKKSNLKLLLLLLLLTAVLLIASTYAWFTANTVVSIAEMDVTVEAKSGLQISADGVTWKSILQLADLDPDTITTTYATAKNQIPDADEGISPVSTALNTNANGELEMFLGTTSSNTSGETVLSASAETDTNADSGNYIAFDIFLKTTNNIETLNLTATGSSVTSTTSPARGIENAARVAFVKEGNCEDGSTTATIQALNGGTSASVTLWEPNYDTHTSAAVSHAYSTYNKTTTTTDAEALDYDGIKAEIDSDSPIAVGATSTTEATYLAAVSPTFRTKTSNTVDQSLTFGTSRGLDAGITKIRVYMWVEGQDVDCENNASGAGLAYKLEFENGDSE